MIESMKKWNTTIEFNVRKFMGESVVYELLTMKEREFSDQMTTLLSLLHVSNSELRCLEEAVISGNRVRVYHVTLSIFFRSYYILDQMGEMGVDEEDIEQHGLFDESGPETLMYQTTINNISSYCPILKDMDLQDMTHYYTRK